MNNSDPVTMTDHNGLPPVTIVIPAYNLIAYLTQTVRSAIQQSYCGELFIVILDDGSKDETYQLALKLAEGTPNIKVETQVNKGRFGARNRLIELAETEWIAWLDGDDIASPHWIENQVDYINKHPQTVAVSGYHYTMTATGHAIGPVHNPLEEAEVERLLMQGNPGVFFQSGAFIKKSALQSAGCYRALHSTSEDYDLWLRLLEKKYQLVNNDKYNIFYRVHAASACWTESEGQHSDVQLALNDYRSRLGLEPILFNDVETTPSAKKDWDHRIYWINIALRSGNPYSAIQLLFPAIKRHPFSLLLWLFWVVAIVDTVLFWGNKTKRFQPGLLNKIGTLPRISLYRFGRFLVRCKRQFRKNSTIKDITS